MDDTRFAQLEAQVTAITKPAPPLLTYFFLIALSGTVVFPFLMLFLYFRYYTLHYRFDEDGVSMGYGVLFRREMHLTYARMQDIHLSQNLFERWLGIGSVTVQTAGGGEGGNLEIVGVREFEAIRDYLSARMRGVREGRGGARTAAGAAAA
ncbi:MAG: PH domain-containing protein, partial [Deltaproteobacteria bacterium]|nr:PH domain-containing protein [Deltaproteobacteria bacterium]